MSTSPVPALSRPYSSRVNVPFGSNNTTALLIHQYSAWALYMHLTNQHTTGTASSVARAANSVWTVRYSCDGTTAGTAGDGVDRWTSTFTPSKLVRAANGVAHSWMVLRNTFSGIELCIDIVGTIDGNGTPAFARSSNPFTGGSTTTRPTASGVLEEWAPGFGRGNPIAGSVSPGLFGTDFTIGGTFYSSCIFGPDATFMHVLHRATTGIAHSAFALWQTVGQQAADTRNWYGILAALSSGRGAPNYSAIAGSTAVVARLPDGAMSTSGGVRGVTYGGTNYPGSYGADFISTKFLCDPIEIREIVPQVVERGFLPDLYIVGTATVGGQFPTVATQTHICLGDLMLPFAQGTAPIL